MTVGWKRPFGGIFSSRCFVGDLEAESVPLLMIIGLQHVLRALRSEVTEQLLRLSVNHFKLATMVDRIVKLNSIVATRARKTRRSPVSARAGRRAESRRQCRASTNSGLVGKIRLQRNSSRDPFARAQQLARVRRFNARVKQLAGRQQTDGVVWTCFMQQTDGVVWTLRAVAKQM